ALERSSVDFYASLRSAYYQDRVAAIQSRSDRGPLAFARRTLRAISLAPSRSEIGDLPANDGRKCIEAVALKHSRVVRAAEGELAHRAVQIGGDDAPATGPLLEPVGEIDGVCARGHHLGLHQLAVVDARVLAHDLKLLSGEAVEVGCVVRDGELREES